MFDNQFDPLKALGDLANNQELLRNNQLTMASTINHVLERLAEQDKTINTMLKALDVSNKANEILMQGLVNDIHKNLAKIPEPTK